MDVSFRHRVWPYPPAEARLTAEVAAARFACGAHSRAARRSPTKAGAEESLQSPYAKVEFAQSDLGERFPIPSGVVWQDGGTRHRRVSGCSIPWHPTTNPHHRRGLPASTSSSVDWSSVGPNGAVDVGAPTCRTTGRAASTPDSVAWCSAGPRGPLTLGHRQLETPTNPRHRRARQPNWAARRVGTSPPPWARGGRIELTQDLF